MKDKDELTVLRIGNYFHLKRVIVEKLDAEEYIRSLGGLEEQYTFMEKQLNTHKIDINKMKKWEQTARDMRDKEVGDAKNQRQNYMG